MTSSLYKHLSGAKIDHPLTTDGQGLAIKGVEINGRLYDLWVWRQDGSGKMVQITTETPFLKDTIEKVSQLAQGFYSDFSEEEILNTKFYCNGTQCEKQNLSGLNNQDSTTDPRINPLQKIHEVFFKEMVVGATLAGSSPLIRPTYEKFAPRENFDVEVEYDEEDFDVDVSYDEDATFSNEILYENKVSFQALSQYIQAQQTGSSIDTDITPVYQAVRRIVEGKNKKEDEETALWLQEVYIDALKKGKKRNTTQKDIDAIFENMAESLSIQDRKEKDRLKSKLDEIARSSDSLGGASSCVVS